MELNWSTFLLEIFNFLILLWILKRFLYKPVLETIARRRASIEKTLADAQAIRAEAEALKKQYESRLDEWGTEKESAREKLHRELHEERDHLMAVLDAELSQAREKARVLDEKRQEDCLRRYQEVCLEQGARFVSRLLSNLAGPEVEERLFDQAMERLDGLPADRLEAIRVACEESPAEAGVISAYPLDDARRTLMAEKLAGLLGQQVACRFGEDPSLLAGLRVTLGPWVFHANLRDELKDFAEATHEPG